MTSLRKSDAQLDAEATQPLEERDLDSAIALHRDLYYTELNWLKQLHVWDGEPESSFCTNPGCLCNQPEGDRTGVTGMAYSHPFEALLNGHLGSFPWSRAMMDLRHDCRTTHTPHVERKEWRGSLCHSLVSLVVRYEYSLDSARFELGLPDEAKSRRTLANALLSIERHLDDTLRREQSRQAQPRSPAEWMGAAHVHQGLGGLHAAPIEQGGCPQCARAA